MVKSTDNVPRENNPIQTISGDWTPFATQIHVVVLGSSGPLSFGSCKVWNKVLHGAPNPRRFHAFAQHRAQSLVFPTIPMTVQFLIITVVIFMCIIFILIRFGLLDSETYNRLHPHSCCLCQSLWLVGLPCVWAFAPHHFRWQVVTQSHYPWMFPWLKDLRATNKHAHTHLNTIHSQHGSGAWSLRGIPRRCLRPSDYGGSCQGSQNCPTGADLWKDPHTDRGRLRVTGRRAGYWSAQDLKPRPILAVNSGTEYWCSRSGNGFMEEKIKVKKKSVN